MKKKFNRLDAELLLALQQGLPLVSRPFAPLAASLGLTEELVLEKIAAFIRAGLVHRFGAVFDSGGLGYASTLCAVAAPAADLPRLAARLQPHPGITHCYQRSGAPALWFTLTAPAAEFVREIKTMARRVAPYELLNLPTRRTFKIGVILDVRRRPPAGSLAAADKPLRRPGRAGSAAVRAAGRTFSARERALVRLLQDNIPLVADPFAAVAGKLKFNRRALLALLRDWRRQGILRRVGLVPYHRELGFAVNGMCVWKVDPRRLAEAGRIIARAPQVTHCYERVMQPRFPFNLFAMLHAKNYPEARRIRSRIAAAAGLSGGRMLVSIREFKKSSPQFFA